MHEHQQKVKRISQEVADFYKRKKPFYIYHGSTNTTRYVQFTKDQTLDISDLNQVLNIDTENHLATVEPNVPMDRLVDATIAKGYVPRVVMEFPGITVGGGIQGFAGESSSYKWGMFQNTCTSLEIVLGNGKQVTTSPTKEPSLYYSTCGSFGSLGVLTSATIQLLPAKKYVQLTYVPVYSFEEAVDTTVHYTKQANYDYIDGIMFNKNSGIIMVGTLSDTKVGKKVQFLRATDNWFYLHAQEIANKRTEYTESIPLKDYLFRYDRGAFWVGRFPYERAHWPFNRFTRWLVDPLLHTRKLYQALHDSGASQQYLIQDLALPVNKTVDFFNYIDTHFNTYPLWICPLQLGKKWTMVRKDSPEFAINIGVWDNHPFYNYDKFIAANRQLESKLNELGGQKWFYAHAYYKEDEFWDIYNKPVYDKLRKQYHAEILPTIYDKIRTKGRKPVSIKRASVRTLFNMTKLKIKP